MVVGILIDKSCKIVKIAFANGRRGEVQYVFGEW